MKQQKISAQRLIDTCEKHGVIKWATLRKLVDDDRCLGAKRGEYLTWKKD
jgi:hypothetical protein